MSNIPQHQWPILDRDKDKIQKGDFYSGEFLNGEVSAFSFGKTPNEVDPKNRFDFKRPPESK